MTKQYKLTNEVHGNIYDTVRALGSEHFASTKDVVVDRNKTPINEGSWSQYGWTREARLLAAQNPAILARDSPLLNVEKAKEAVEANRRGELVYLTKATYDSQLKTAEKDAKKPVEKRSILILPSRDTFTISPTKYFEVMEFLAGRKNAEKYFDRLSEAKITELTFGLPESSFVDKQKAPFVQQSWLLDLADGSDLDGSDWCLGCGRAFGVFPVSERASASTRKISEGKNSELPYTSRQVEKALLRAEAVKAGNKGTNSLDSVIEFLESLRK